MNSPLLIGTRDSALALWQAKTLQEKLKKLGVETTLIPVKKSRRFRPYSTPLQHGYNRGFYQNIGQCFTQ